MLSAKLEHLTKHLLSSSSAMLVVDVPLQRVVNSKLNGIFFHHRRIHEMAGNGHIPPASKYTKCQCGAINCIYRHHDGNWTISIVCLTCKLSNIVCFDPIYG